MGNVFASYFRACEKRRFDHDQSARSLAFSILISAEQKIYITSQSLVDGDEKFSLLSIMAFF